MIATAMVVKEIYGEEVAIIYMGPCIDNKDEALMYRGGKLIEGILTFIELRQLFNESESRRESLKCLSLIRRTDTGELSTLFRPGSYRQQVSGAIWLPVM
jgi:iron only hydrogenase large subunit-like protein